MGPVKIGENLTGNNGSSSALIASAAGLSSITIGGSITGGDGDSSGGISSQAGIASVTVGTKAHPGGITGGQGDSSGLIVAQKSIPTLTINGALIAGPANRAGGVIAASLGSVLISGDDNGGFLAAVTGGIASVTIDGSLLTDAAASSSAFIGAQTILGAIKIKGSITGVQNPLSSSPVVISAGGNGGQRKSDLAIKSISVGGDVSVANIFAGYDINESPIDHHAQIGPVAVTGNWIASNIVAGAQNAASSNTYFGNGNDAPIPAASSSDTSTTLSSIASIKIGGIINGTDFVAVPAEDHFGFVAEFIGSLSVNGVKQTLAAGPSNDDIALGSTGDFNLHEIG